MNNNPNQTYDTPSLFAPLDKLANFGWPLARIITGLLMIPHGAQKLFGWFGGHGLSGTGQFFEGALGMSPGILWAGAAGMVEFFGGLLLVFGLLTRPAAAATAVLMAVAMSVHVPQGFFWSAGGIEYPLMWMVLAIAIFFRGGGAYSLDSALGLRI